jgi:hypothetical protein
MATCFTKTCAEPTMSVHHAYCAADTARIDAAARERMGYHCHGCGDPYVSYVDLLEHQGPTFECPGSGVLAAPRKPSAQS